MTTKIIKKTQQNEKKTVKHALVIFPFLLRFGRRRRNF